jgi:antitoxin MazE
VSIERQLARRVQLSFFPFALSTRKAFGRVPACRGVLDDAQWCNYIVPMKARIIRIGNSQGVRIPKVMIEQSRLGEEVELDVEGDSIIIRPVRITRDGWDEAFAHMAEAGDDRLLDEPLRLLTSWDEDEWQW